MGETRQRQGEWEAGAAHGRSRTLGRDAGQQKLDQTVRVNKAAAVPLPGDSEMSTNSIPQRKRWSRSVKKRKREKQALEEVNQMKGTECILSFVLISARAGGELQHV